MRLRVLHPDRDERLFRQAWKWRLAYPRLVRQWDGLKHFRQWFALMKRRVSVGVFSNHLFAIVTFRPDGEGIFEVHVDCERGTEASDLLIALLNIEQVVFKEWGTTEIFGAVISKHCGILQIAAACGFQQDGIEYTIGRLKWVRVAKIYAKYQHPEGYIPDNEYVWQGTGSRVA